MSRQGRKGNKSNRDVQDDTGQDRNMIFVPIYEIIT